MIEEGYKRKVCDLCRKTVAIKKFLRYETLEPYYKLDRNTFDEFGRNFKAEAHFCRDCWNRMRNRVKLEMDRDKKLRRAKDGSNQP